MSPDPMFFPLCGPGISFPVFISAGPHQQAADLQPLPGHLGLGSITSLGRATARTANTAKGRAQSSVLHFLPAEVKVQPLQTAIALKPNSLNSAPPHTHFTLKSLDQST
jgi:hypothetical protein